MSDSRRSEPRIRRAERRAALPSVRARRASPGRHHPASVADVRSALTAFGPDAYYGVRTITLRPARGERVLGALVGPGEIELYDQPPSPWRMGAPLAASELERLGRAGADVSVAGVVSWPDDTLAAFMIGHVLAHELGHHMLQHERRLKGERAARTREHEARAELIAAQLRARL